MRTLFFVLTKNAMALLACWFLFRTLSCLFVIRQSLWRRILLLFCCWMQSNMIIYTGDLFNLPLTLGIFLFGIWNGCEGSKQKRIVIGLMIASAVLASNGLHDNSLASVLYRKELSLALFGVIFRAVFSLTLFLWTRKNRPSTDFELSKALWKVLLQLTFIPFGIVCALVLFRSPWDEPGTWLADCGLFLVALFSFVGLFHALLVLERQQRLEQENLLAQHNQKYYEAMEEQQFEIRRLKHDLNNHLQTLLMLPEEKRQSYIKEMLQNSVYARVLAYSGDATVNAVLSAKAAMLSRKELPFHVKADISEELPFEKADICALFSNALDNAAEAALQLPAEKREIALNARAAKGMLAVSVENTCPEKDSSHFSAVSDGLPETTKKDTKHHGYGLLSMRKVVKKYGGGMEISRNEGTFRLFFYLPLNPVQTAGYTDKITD